MLMVLTAHLSVVATGFSWDSLKPQWSLPANWQPEKATRVPVFVLSLPKSKRRIAHMKAQLAAQRIEFEVVPAIFGDQHLRMQYASLRDHLLGPSFLNPHPRNLAVALSHMRFYDQMVQRNMSQALILEDDVVLNPNLMRDLRKLLVPMAARLYADFLFVGWNRHLCKKECVEKVPRDIIRCGAGVRRAQPGRPSHAGPYARRFQTGQTSSDSEGGRLVLKWACEDETRTAVPWNFFHCHHPVFHMYRPIVAYD